MMRAQLLAQQFDQSGQMPADNEMAGNVVVRHSPLEYLSRQVSKNMATQQQLDAYKAQLQLQGQQMASMFGNGQSGQGGTGTAGGGSISNTGIDPVKARAALMMGGQEGLQKYVNDALAPTVNQKDDSTAGGGAGSYQKITAQNSANASAEVKPFQVNSPNGGSYMSNELNVSGGGQPPQTRLPLNAVNNAMGGMGNTDVAPTGAPSGLPPAIPNGAAVPPVAPVQGEPLPPPAGFAQANGSIPPQAGAMAPISGFKDPVQASTVPPSIAPQQAAQNTPQVPFSQMVQNSAPNVGGGMQVQSPAQAEAAKATALSPITAKTAGDTKAQENYQAYRQGLNTTTSNLGKEVGIANAQDDFKKLFQPGAGETQLAQAAAAAASAGASPSLQQMIARGDPGAVQAFDALASQESVRQMEGMLAGNGNSNPRITQAMFDNFKEDLSNPNKQANAIEAIHNMMRLQYKTTYEEQQAALADKGDPTTFQERYQATKYPTLMNGRGADPSAAIQKGSVQSQIPPTGAQQVGTKGGKPVYKLPDGRGWMPD